MALTGVLVTCGYLSSRSLTDAACILIGKLSWTEQMQVAGTTTHSAPSYDEQLGSPAFEVRPSVDIVVAYGAAPDPIAGPRIFLPAGETRNMFCQTGDRLAWALAS